MLAEKKKSLSPRIRFIFLGWPNLPPKFDIELLSLFTLEKIIIMYSGIFLINNCQCQNERPATTQTAKVSSSLTGLKWKYHFLSPGIYFRCFLFQSSADT
jgi:hypothetical protein